MKPSLLTLSMLLVLTGCTALGPEYKPTSVAEVLDKSASVKAAQPVVTGAEAIKADSWWNNFQDPALTQLLAMAYTHNRTLTVARANLAAARYAWDYNKGALWPTVDLNGGITRQENSRTVTPGANAFTNYQLGVGARWELDFFGREQFLADAARAEAEATEADFRAMWVSVSANLANYYLELRTLQGRLMVAEDNLRLQQSNYDLQIDRAKSGLTNDLIKNQAEYDLRSTAAAIPSLKSQIVAAENAIAILCGTTPGTLPEALLHPIRHENPEQAKAAQQDACEDCRVAGLRPTGIPQGTSLNLKEGIPADSLRRRPDVIAAERRLKSSVDVIGSAEAERYPTIYIAGDLGLNSLDAGDFFKSESKYYSFGPGITVPIFHGGQIKTNIKIKNEQQKAALANYENVVLSALGDIRTALSGYEYEQERLRQLRLGVQAAQAAYEIASNKYNAGLGDFFDVLDAQRQLFALDEARVISEGTIAKNQVSLYRALCGGWVMSDPATGKDTPVVAEPLLQSMEAEED